MTKLTVLSFQRFPVRTTILQCTALGFIAFGGTVLRAAAWETKIKEGEVEPSSVMKLKTRGVVDLPFMCLLRDCNSTNAL